VYCGATWDEATIGILAESVRLANGEHELHDTGELPSIGVLA
jgi:hypothetical protein